jgi:hypothetical protein
MLGIGIPGGFLHKKNVNILNAYQNESGCVLHRALYYFTPQGLLNKYCFRGLSRAGES